MKLSVIIPCKNEVGVVDKLLASLRNQTQTVNEIIVVDSNSTDGTAEHVRTIAKGLPLKVVIAPKKGVAEARNFGAAQASGDTLLFLDADAEVPVDFIINIKHTLERKKWAVAGLSQRMASRKLGIRVGARMMNVYARTMSHTPWPIAISAIVSSREAFQKLGGFDPELWIMEDYDYALRARRAGFRFGIISSTYFNASDRRYINASLGDSLQGIYAELYRYTHRLRITKPLYRYDMGGKEKKQS